jgi:hypothetical protein
VYDDGKPDIDGIIIASVLWHVHPAELLPVLPVELASARFTPATVSIKRPTAMARTNEDITSRLESLY